MNENRFGEPQTSKGESQPVLEGKLVFVNLKPIILAIISCITVAGDRQQQDWLFQSKVFQFSGDHDLFLLCGIMFPFEYMGKYKTLSFISLYELNYMHEFLKLLCPGLYNRCEMESVTNGFGRIYYLDSK